MQSCVVACFIFLCVVIADERPGHCEDGQTCCQHSSNGYDCCPFVQAECCTDRVHCCPKGMTCDLETSQCVNATHSVPWAKRTTAQHSISRSFRMIKSNSGDDNLNILSICPDQSHCPPEFSCILALNKYRCCPLAQGISCSDRKHCCPESHSCSDDSRSCLKKVAGLVDQASNDTSCCSERQGDWGCCPFSKATCCPDNEHCCPHGYKCIPQNRACVKDRVEIPWYNKVPSQSGAKPVHVEIFVNEQGQNQSEKSEEEAKADEDNDDEDESENDLVRCDHKTTCPKNHSCCSFRDGWGCCPFKQGVCCSDGEHCCPHRYKCDESHRACVLDDEDDEEISWFTKLPAPINPGNYERCPDQPSCVAYNTCCQMSTGEDSYVVCCKDEKHCCPAGFSCDSSSGHCQRSVVLEEPFVPLAPAQSEPADRGSMRCGSENCPENNKCCMNRGVSYCCPYENGVCCNNNNCCPSGQSCSWDGQCTSHFPRSWKNWLSFFKINKESPQTL